MKQKRRLTLTWDVLKLRNCLVNSILIQINFNMGCIETHQGGRVRT